MRISDWSSDVCSSDLRVAVGQAAPEEQHGADSGGDGEVADGLVAEPVIAGAFLDDVFETAEKQAHRGKAEEVKALEQNGRASCRERECQYVEISVVAVSLKKKTKAREMKKT